MTDTPESRTRVTLLDRLRRDPADADAWGEFVRHYGAKVLSWCRHWGLQEADAQDVTQQVLLQLAEVMRTFAYDPQRSFRAWLKAVAQHAWSNYVRGREHPGRGSGDDEVVRLLDRLPAREDLAARLEEQFDHELLEEACGRVRLRVEARTWEAFRLTALEGLPGAEAARRTGLPVAHVFMAKHRVEKLLQEEVQRLDG
jgi:RNA polymerase sigma-70 factor (ECF subfamily)